MVEEGGTMYNYFETYDVIIAICWRDLKVTR